MEHSKKNIDQYLGMYPQLQKWINHCPLCGARGRKSDMPDAISGTEGNTAAHHLKRMLPALEVDEDGFCMVCSRIYRKQK